MFSFHFRLTLYGLSKISADIYYGAPLRTLADILRCCGGWGEVKIVLTPV